MSDSLKKYRVLAFGKLECANESLIVSSALSGQYQTDKHHKDTEDAMGKYFLAWLLGVPAVVLVLIYFFMH
jgi:hypothetical protein